MTRRPLGRVSMCASVTSHQLRLDVQWSPHALRGVRYVEFSPSDDAGHIRSGQVSVVAVDPETMLLLSDHPCSAQVPAIATGDYIFAWVDRTLGPPPVEVDADARREENEACAALAESHGFLTLASYIRRRLPQATPEEK